MFTGIVTHIGQITDVQKFKGRQAGVRVAVQVPNDFLTDVALGDSIAIQGACMTVVAKEEQVFWVDISQESLQHTTNLSSKGPVNLEKALRASDRLGGHLVTGHVDEVGRVVEFHPIGESYYLKIAVSPRIAHFMAYKGSVTINGVSLTVNSVDDEAESTYIAINLIPHTIQNTTLQYLQVDDAVNIEIDVFARYIERQSQYEQAKKNLA